jgi:hypothetical protein
MDLINDIPYDLIQALNNKTRINLPFDQRLQTPLPTYTPLDEKGKISFLDRTTGHFLIFDNDYGFFHLLFKNN